MLATVHISQIGQNIHIELDGSGFGPAPVGLPAVTNLGQFQVADITQGNWCAGHTNCPVTLQYTTWNDGLIVIDGFGPQYGAGTNRMLPGDQTSIFVQSTTAGAGSATWTGTIQNEAPPPPDPNGPTPRVASVSFSQIGQNMHIEVAGSGFSTAPVGLPAVANLSVFQIADITQGNWCAGHNNCPVSLQYTTWNDGLIVIDGFGPQYGANVTNKVAVNDAVSIYVQNAGGPEFMVWTGTLQEGPPLPPDPNGPSPRVTSVSFSQIGQNMHVEVAGSGFSTAPVGLPAVTNLGVFQIADITQGNWCAGHTNCPVSLQYTTWNDGLIVIDGFGPQYGANVTNKVAVNDAVSIYVQNAHGPEFMVWTGVLQASPAPGPDPGGPTPRVASVTFSQVGATMHIEVDGSGFGTQPIGLPATTNIAQFQLQDVTQAGWCAGHVNCPVTLQYTSWTDTKIVVGGFGPQYGGLNQVVSGDAVSFYVQNSGGPEFMVWSGTLP